MRVQETLNSRFPIARSRSVVQVSGLPGVKTTDHNAFGGPLPPLMLSPVPWVLDKAGWPQASSHLVVRIFRSVPEYLREKLQLTANNVASAHGCMGQTFASHRPRPIQSLSVIYRERYSGRRSEARPIFQRSFKRHYGHYGTGPNLFKAIATRKTSRGVLPGKTGVFYL